jgi:hypothetical protein
MHLSCLPCIPYPRSVSFITWLPQYLVSTDHKAHHYIVFITRTPLIVTESIWSYFHCTMFQPLSSAGRFTLRNQKKYHTCYSSVSLIMRSILPKHLTFNPVVKQI